MNQPTPTAFHAIGCLAAHARSYRMLARDHRECALQGLSPQDNLRQARRMERQARECEAHVRRFADQVQRQAS